MGIARSLFAQDAVVRIGRGVLRHRRAKAGANLHAFKDAVDPVAIEPLHPPQPGTHIVLLAHSLLSPLDREMVIASEGLDPVVVLNGPLPQDFLGDGASAVHAAEEVHDVLRTGQERQIAEDDDTVETVACKCQQFTKQFGKFFHRSSSSLALESPTRALGQRTGGDQIRGKHRYPDWNTRRFFSPALRRAARNFKYFWLEFDPLDFVQRNLIFGPIVEFRGA